MSGRRRMYIVGCYIAPDDAQTIERVVKALKDKTPGSALIVAGDMNTDLGEVDGDRRGTEISAALTEAGLEDRYRVVATDAPSRHRGRIAVFYREGARFAVEEVHQYGTNVISVEVVSGRR